MNEGEGIKIHGDNNTFINVLVNSSNFEGIWFSSASNNSKLINATSILNPYGIRLSSGTNGPIENSRACGNDNTDFVCDSPADDYSNITNSNTYGNKGTCGAWLGPSVGSC